MAPQEAREVVTPDNLSPVISIMTWILMSSSILAVTAKVWMKRALSRTLGVEDWILILSLVSPLPARSLIYLT
jgi:heme/copper-type cytochrome/quinol oxidase subunit 3